MMPDNGHPDELADTGINSASEPIYARDEGSRHLDTLKQMPKGTVIISVRNRWESNDDLPEQAKMAPGIADEACRSANIEEVQQQKPILQQGTSEDDPVGDYQPNSTQMWWFPVLESAPEKRLALGVRLWEGEERPDPKQYRDQLANRYQTLIDRDKKASEAIEDLLIHSMDVLMADPDGMGEAIVETDEVLMLVADALEEIEEKAPLLDPETQKRLAKAAEKANLRNLLALI